VGTPSARVDGLAVEAMGSVPADVRVHAMVVEALGVYIGPPNIPENVAAVPYVFSADLNWDPPSGGYPVDYFQVRIDGGTWMRASRETFRFLGLAGGTTYHLEVRGVNLGGPGPAAAVDTTTFAAGATPDGYYRVVVTAGPHTWTGTSLDVAPDEGVVLPVSLSWAVPDQVDWFPTMADPSVLQFRLRVDDMADLSDVDLGTTVTFRMYIQVDVAAEPWQSFDGIVTDMRAALQDPHGDPHYLVTIMAADDNMRLDGITIGYAADWPQESIYDRVVRIATEAGVDPAFYRLGTGVEGTLGARAANPTTALAALRAALQDVANDNSSEPPGEYYGRMVFHYYYAANDYAEANELRIQPFERRVYPGTTVTLDGCRVDAGGDWAKLPTVPVRTWALIDGATWGVNDGTPPIVINTSLVDTLPGTNYSAVTRDNLGESLLPDGSTQLTGWYARQIRYTPQTQAEALLVTQWASFTPYVVVQPVVVEDVDPRYRLNGETYLAGTLTGATLVIPPGGAYYLDLRLRPELLPGTELP
jgi:hypothetical protein